MFSLTLRLATSLSYITDFKVTLMLNSACFQHLTTYTFLEACTCTKAKMIDGWNEGERPGHEEGERPEHEEGERPGHKEG